MKWATKDKTALARLGDDHPLHGQGQQRRHRLKDSSHWTGGRFADGFVFRNGKITQYLSFGERAEARRWAELEDQEATT
jgi:hypothetical protein